MDRQFIKLMVESYFNDKNLNSLNLWANRNTCVTELNNEIVTLINNIKLENESFYFELHNLGRGNQQELIYKMLDNFIRVTSLYDEKTSQHLQDFIDLS